MGREAQRNDERSGMVKAAQKRGERIAKER